jgi:5-methylcytosine-specific restriction endonuclease McrA
MFCAHPSCQRDVDINSVATNQIRGAVTFDNPNSEFNPTIVKSNSNIVNVCKSCGESAYLYTNKKAYEMERHLAKLEAAEKEHDIKAAKVFFSNPIVTSVMGLLMLACYLLQAWDKGSIWFLEWSWEYDLMMSLLAMVSLLIAAICLPLAIFTTPGFLKAGGTKAWRQKVDSLRLEIEPNRTAKSPEYYKKRNLKKKKGKSTGKIKPSYYYHDVGSGEAKGPYTETELKSLERESQIDEFTQICEEGSDEWVNYNSKNLRRDLP